MPLRDFLGLPATRHAELAAPRPMRFPSRPRAGRRSWDPTSSGRLFGDFAVSTGDADEEVRLRQVLERARSRALERNNPWAVRYFRLYTSNVFGPEGIRLIPRVMTFVPKSAAKPATWIPDDAANEIIRDAWLRWGRFGQPTVDGRHSWPSLQRTLGVSCKRDGEAFAREYRGARFGEYGYQVQLLEADHCPTTLSRDLQNGNRLHMGIERNSLDRPVAYWLSLKHPGAYGGLRLLAGGLDRYVRVPADEIIHFYEPRRIGQSRGLPHLESGIASLHMLAGYEEAELVAARAASSKMGWIVSETGGEYVGDGEAGPEGDGIDDGSIPETLEPGVIGQLARDQKFEGFDPQHPTNAFVAFLKQMLRRFASVAGVGYNSLANDLEGVNFSSLRQGALAERDLWKDEQAMFIEAVAERMFDSWLEAALLGSKLGSLPIEKLDKFRGHRWQGRRWEWIDPVKEAQAAEIALDNCTTSISAIIQSQGREPREVFEEIAADQALAESLGIEAFLPYEEPRRPAPAGAPANEGT
jgi:lambda family phage portal protein